MKANIFKAPTRWALMAVLMAASCPQGWGQNIVTGPAISQSECLIPNTVSKFGNEVSINSNDRLYSINNFVPEIIDKEMQSIIFRVTDANTIIIPNFQYLGLNSKYGECYLCKCDQNGTNISTNQQAEYIEGRIDNNGTITIPGSWCVAYSNELAAGYKAVRVARNTVIRHANATMETTNHYYNEKETYHVYVEQSSNNEKVSVTNFGDFGQTVEINVNPDKTITIPSQLVYDSDESVEKWNDGTIFYDFKTFACNWTLLTLDNAISGNISSKEIKFGNWVMMDKNRDFPEDFAYNDGKITLSGERTFGFPENYYLGVYPESYIFSADGEDSKSFTISSNVKWKVSSEENWIHFTPQEGSGESYVKVTVDRNPTTENRLGTITVYSTIGNVRSQTITIGQNGQPIQEVTESGVKYKLDYASETATLLEVEKDESGTGKVEIPEEVEVDVSSVRETRAGTTKNFKVKALGDSIMAHMALNMRSLDCITFPASITTVSEDAFAGAKTKSIIWKSDTKMPEDAFQTLSDDKLVNMLVYVNKESYAPKAVKNKIVKQNAAGDYSIGDIDIKEDNEFYCPLQFDADNVTFTHKFKMKSGLQGDGAQGWETIVLPFDVESISYEKDGNIYNLLPFDKYAIGHGDSDRPFWLYEWDGTAFRSASGMVANKPYLISMPNNPEYADDYCIEGDVVFKAFGNAAIKETDVEMYYTKGFCASYAFIGNEHVSQGNILRINSESDVSGHSSFDYLYPAGETPAPGSRFVSLSLCKYPDTSPFEGFMLSDSPSGTREWLDINFASNNEYGIMDSQGIVDCKSPQTVHGRGVYSLSGQYLGDCQWPQTDSGIPLKLDLPAGVYIINGKKRAITK